MEDSLVVPGLVVVCPSVVLLSVWVIFVVGIGLVVSLEGVVVAGLRVVSGGVVAPSLSKYFSDAVTMIKDG